MKNITHWKFRSKLLALPTVAGVAFLAVLAVSFGLGRASTRALEEVTQGHVPAYQLGRDLQGLLERIQRGEIDPTFIITHKLSLEDAPKGYDIFLNKQDECVKVVLKP